MPHASMRRMISIPPVREIFASIRHTATSVKARDKQHALISSMIFVGLYAYNITTVVKRLQDRPRILDGSQPEWMLAIIVFILPLWEHWVWMLCLFLIVVTWQKVFVDTFTHIYNVSFRANDDVSSPSVSVDVISIVFSALWTGRAWAALFLCGILAGTAGHIAIIRYRSMSHKLGAEAKNRFVARIIGSVYIFHLLLVAIAIFGLSLFGNSCSSDL